HESLEIPASNIKKSMTEILKNEGFIKDYEVVEDNKQNVLRIFLKYGKDQQRIISGLKRISRPGLRSYVDSDNVQKVINGLGIAILSTTKGVITDKEARVQHVGGEVIAYIW